MRKQVVHMMALLKQRRAGETGQGFVEYALILAFAALVVIVVINILEPSIADVFSRFVRQAPVAPPSLVNYTPPPTFTPLPTATPDDPDYIPPPFILIQPTNVTVTEPEEATFTVLAEGIEPLTYQWRRNGTDIPGAQAASYTLDPTSEADNGAQFTVLVSNAYGQTLSHTAILTVLPPPEPPAIETQPNSVTVTEPEPATFRVVASGDEPLSYQWWRNGAAIPGATEAVYTLDPTAVADDGAQFWVVVSSPHGPDVTSQTVTLTVNPPPPCPYGPYAVPGRVQMQNFTCGGQGEAFHEVADGGPGSAILNRQDGVGAEGPDFQATTDPQGGGFNLISTSAGEWIRYKVEAPQAHRYDMVVRYASTSGSIVRIRITSDGCQPFDSGNVTLPATGGQQSWSSVTLSAEQLGLCDGVNTVEFQFVTAGTNYNFFDFALYVPPPTQMHVSNLSATSAPQGANNWRATFTITVRDNQGNLVSGANVSGAWSVGNNSPGSCTTNAVGQCSITTGNIDNNNASTTFTVTGITHGSLNYNAAANVVSFITVNRP